MKLSNFDFRIWNESEKCFHSNACIFKDSLKNRIKTGEIIENIDKTLYDDEDFYNLDNLEIELWTGFYDKNGEKIYEGDIVEYYENEVLKIKYIKGAFHACQDYEKFMKKWDCQDNKDTEKFWMDEAYKIYNLKIDDEKRIVRFIKIGNIHENKNLLK